MITVEPLQKNRHPLAADRKTCVELDGMLLHESALAVVVDWHETSGIGYVRMRGTPNGALLKHAALKQSGFDTTQFGDVFVCDVENFDGVRVATNIRAATAEDLETP